MNTQILDHFLQFSTYTYPGCYQQKLRDALPDDVREMGALIRKNIVRRSRWGMSERTAI